MDVRTLVAGARPGSLRVVLLLVPLIAVVLATMHVPPAAGAQKCAARIFKDWTDNHRIDRVYDLPCYRAAIKALPVDVRTYSSAEDDIRRAMLYAQSDQSDPGDKGPPPAAAPSTTSTKAPAGPPPAAAKAVGNGTAASAAAAAAAADAAADPPLLESRLDRDRPASVAGSSIAPVDHASLPVPLPLIGLAAVSTVLLALGSIGYLTRRIASHLHSDG